MEKYENVSTKIVQQYLTDNIFDDSRSRKYDKVYKQYAYYVTQTDLNQNDKQIIKKLYWLDYECLFAEWLRIGRMLTEKLKSISNCTKKSVPIASFDVDCKACEPLC